MSIGKLWQKYDDELVERGSHPVEWPSRESPTRGGGGRLGVIFCGCSGRISTATSAIGGSALSRESCGFSGTRRSISCETRPGRRSSDV